MNELKCIIVNASPYGPQNEESGIGKNTRLLYIPLDKELMLESDKFIGYNTKYNDIWENSQKSWFDYIKKEKLILCPVLITYSMDINRHCTIGSIKKI